MLSREGRIRKGPRKTLPRLVRHQIVGKMSLALRSQAHLDEQTVQWISDGKDLLSLRRHRKARADPFPDQPSNRQI